MRDISDCIERRKLISQIETDVDAYCRETMRDDPREHLGASVIGDPCQAKIWNDFRWLKQEQFTGRILRLFERGKLEENRFVALLRGIGFEVKEFDESGAQFKISGVDGHFGGSLDGLVKAPARYELEGVGVVEFKTHGENSFKKLIKDGVRISKPIHYGQMCCYGRAYNLKWGLYVAVNKNTDELYFEIVPLDYLHADDMFRRADAIIHAQEQPVKIALTETFFQCKTCVHSGICHEGEKPQKNCRSCKYATPIKNGKWNCGNQVYTGSYTCTLDTDRIKKGCAHWEPIING